MFNHFDHQATKLGPRERTSARAGPVTLENRCAGHLGNLARLSDARFRGVSKVLMNRIELDH